MTKSIYLSMNYANGESNPTVYTFLRRMFSMERIMMAREFRKIAQNVIDKERERKQKLDQMAENFTRGIKKFVFLEHDQILIDISLVKNEELVKEFINSKGISIERQTEVFLFVKPSRILVEKRSMIKQLYSDLKILATSAAEKGEFDFIYPYHEEDWEYTNGWKERISDIQEYIRHFGFDSWFDKYEKKFKISF